LQCRWWPWWCLGMVSLGWSVDRTHLLLCWWQEVSRDKVVIDLYGDILSHSVHEAKWLVRHLQLCIGWV
jgi:hypothetical protein